MTEQSHTVPAPPLAAAAPAGSANARRSWTIGLVFVVLVALVAGAELFVRHQLRSSVSDAMSNGLHTSAVDVGIGSSPALLDLSRGRIDTVSLSARKATMCEVNDVSFDATVQDVSTSPSGGRIGASTLRLTLSGRSLNDLLAGSGKAKGVTATTEPRSDVVRLVGMGGLATVTVRPRVTDGQLDFRVTSASLAGRPVAPAKAQRLLNGGSRAAFGTLPLGLRATGARVTDRGLETSFRGRPTTLPADRQPLNCAGQ